MGNVVAYRVLPELFVEFSGERHAVPSHRTFTIGRGGDLDVDDNPYLHRHFLALRSDRGMWWIANEGSHLTATVVDDARTVEAVVAPGGRLPVIAPRLHVLFVAGSTQYDLHLITDPVADAADDRGTRARRSTLPADAVDDETLGRVRLNLGQRRLLVVLAERRLRSPGSARIDLPGSVEAAARLGCTVTAFTRRLDYLCERLAQAGVHGLRAGDGGVATLRRVRLVDYALATGLVGVADLVLLDAEVSAETSAS